MDKITMDSDLAMATQGYANTIYRLLDGQGLVLSGKVQERIADIVASAVASTAKDSAKAFGRCCVCNEVAKLNDYSECPECQTTCDCGNRADSNNYTYLCTACAPGGR